MERAELSSILNGAKGVLHRLQEESGVEFSRCYQCGKCSAGCPVAFAMDFTPRQIVRLLQLGMVDQAIRSHTIWLCACCETCYSRCPREINLPAVMETLRMHAKEKGIVSESKINLFNDLFLESVAQNGRVHEMGLILRYNLRSGQPFKDAALAPTLLRQGKISLRAEKIAGRDTVRRIFDKAKNRKGGGGH